MDRAHSVAAAMLALACMDMPTACDSLFDRLLDSLMCAIAWVCAVCVCDAGKGVCMS